MESERVMCLRLSGGRQLMNLESCPGLLFGLTDFLLALQGRMPLGLVKEVLKA